MIPIVIGVAATVAALTARATFSAIAKFNKLPISAIAAINNIDLGLSHSSHSHPGAAWASDPHMKQDIDRILRTFANTPFGEPMTENEALMVLGITPDEILSLNKQFVKNRYRQLMLANHPDKHGSKYLAQKINQAKTVLENSKLVE